MAQGQYDWKTCVARSYRDALNRRCRTCATLARCTRCDNRLAVFWDRSTSWKSDVGRLSSCETLSRSCCTISLPIGSADFIRSLSFGTLRSACLVARVGKAGVRVRHNTAGQYAGGLEKSLHFSTPRSRHHMDLFSQRCKVGYPVSCRSCIRSFRAKLSEQLRFTPGAIND